MSKAMTLAFFRVDAHNQGVQQFATALGNIRDKPLADREANARGTTIRLERMRREMCEGNPIYRGEFSKIVLRDSVDFPSIAEDDGLKELEANKLGYGAAFLYDQKLSIICLQYNRFVFGYTILSAYMHAHDENNGYTFSPILADDAEAKVRNGQVKKIRVKAAAADKFGSESNSMGKSIRELGEMYQAPSITLEISVGRKKDTFLSRIFSEEVIELSNNEALTTLVVTTEEDGPIDLKNLLISDKVEVVDDDKDPEKSYTARSNSVLSCWLERRQQIASILEVDL